jgi:hypothetical protein
MLTRQQQPTWLEVQLLEQQACGRGAALLLEAQVQLLAAGRQGGILQTPQYAQSAAAGDLQ